MNSFLQDRSLGAFLAALGLSTLLSLWFLFYERSQADQAQRQFESTITELNRLRASSPFPNEENLKKTRAQNEVYRTSLLRLENELKTRMFPRLPLQPNEFQAQLRLAVTAIQEKATASKVELPPNFNLGFDQYATSLPNGKAAPRLGRQLRAIEWIVNTIIEAHADALTSLIRSPLPEEKAAPTPNPRMTASAPKKEAGERIVESTSVNLAFSGTPAATRRILNQLAAARDQFYLLRTLVVKNQVDKGPKRGAADGATPAPTPPTGPGARSKEPIRFIVGTEHLNVATRIEIVKFAIPEKLVR